MSPVGILATCLVKAVSKATLWTLDVNTRRRIFSGTAIMPAIRLLNLPSQTERPSRKGQKNGTRPPPRPHHRFGDASSHRTERFAKHDPDGRYHSHRSSRGTKTPRWCRAALGRRSPRPGLSGRVARTSGEDPQVPRPQRAVEIF